MTRHQHFETSCGLQKSSPVDINMNYYFAHWTLKPDKGLKSGRNISNATCEGQRPPQVRYFLRNRCAIIQGHGPTRRLHYFTTNATDLGSAMAVW